MAAACWSLRVLRYPEGSNSSYTFNSYLRP
jgi:hypothetical protein